MDQHIDYQSNDIHSEHVELLYINRVRICSRYFHPHCICTYNSEKIRVGELNKIVHYVNIKFTELLGIDNEVNIIYYTLASIDYIGSFFCYFLFACKYIYSLLLSLTITNNSRVSLLFFSVIIKPYN